MSSNQKVLIFTGPEGHLSIAQAIQIGLKNDGFHTIMHHSAMKSGMKVYMPFYRMFPSLFKIPFQLTQLQTSKKIIEKIINNSQEGKDAWKVLAKNKPDVIISTWWAANHILAEYAKDSNTPFFNALTDPRTISSLIPYPNAHNLTFDKKAGKACKQLNIGQKNILQTGWFVRPQFEKEYNQVKSKKDLSIPKDELTFLVCGGSDGTNAVLKIIPALLSQTTKVRIYFVCGSNKALFKVVKGFTKVFQTTQNNIEIIPLGFTNQLEKYMQAADLVIGKAGPNLIFETIATLTPFFAITHISGQEDGNLEIIKESKLGFVEENPIKATKLLKKIIKDRSMLDKFTPHLKKMKLKNKQSTQILNQSISHELQKKAVKN